MPASSRSTVIEILYPTSMFLSYHSPTHLLTVYNTLQLAYIHDYSIVARSMGHKHYGVWNDETLTFPEGKWFDVRRLICLPLSYSHSLLLVFAVSTLRVSNFFFRSHLFDSYRTGCKRWDERAITWSKHTS